jgi:hypothetical protein
MQNIEPQALTAKIFQNKELAEYFAVELSIFFIPEFANIDSRHVAGLRSPSCLAKYCQRRTYT